MSQPDPALPPAVAVQSISGTVGTKRWLPGLSVFLSCFQLLAGGVLAMFGVATRSDSYSHAADRWWGAVAVAAGILLASSGVSVIVFLLVRKRAAGIAAMTLLALTLVGLGTLIDAGANTVTEAKVLGGDWGGLRIISAEVFGVFCPGLLACLTLASAVCLGAGYRRTISEAGTTSATAVANRH